MKKPTLLTCRRTVQIVVALAFVVIPWLNHMQISFVYGNFLSFHLFAIPLADPLAVLQVTLKNAYWSTDLFIGAGIALIIAVLVGTAFCSWVCPFGLLSELSHSLSRRIRGKRAQAARRHGWGFRVKFILFAIGFPAFFIFSTTPVLNQLSLPAWYSRIFQFWFEQWHVSLAIVSLAAILAVEAVAGRRIWCRYVCPQSVLITLAKQVNRRRVRVHFNTDACLSKGKIDPCTQACTLHLDPKRLSRWPENECNNCGDCVVACSKRGKALTFRRRPTYGKD